MGKRSTILLLVLTCLAGLSRIACAQVLLPPSDTQALHLLSACPTPKLDIGFESELYRFDDQRKRLSLVRKLDTRKSGVEFILADYGSRLLVVGTPRLTPKEINLIYMDAAGTSAVRPLDFGNVPAAAWEPWPTQVVAMGQKAGVLTPRPPSLVSKMLVDRPGRGHWLALRLASDRGVAIAGFPIEEPKPLAPRELLGSDIYSHLWVTGDFGLADLGDSDARRVRIRQGRVFLDARFSIDLGITAPEVQTQPSDDWWLMAHSDLLTVMRRARDPAGSPEGDGPSPLHVFTKRTGRWTTFRVPGTMPVVKAIGSWIMGATASEKLGRESPGQSERRRRPPTPPYRGDGPPPRDLPTERPLTDERFHRGGRYYPGMLFLIDTATGRYYEIRTDQGDSEILLVNESSVYYRVNKRLLVGTIQAGLIGPPHLLVEDDAVPEVHWAFMGH